MITLEKRKSLIIKYLTKNPLSTSRQIRTNSFDHEYHSKYLQRLLDELIQERKVGIFQQRFFAIPKPDKEINLLINIIKSVSLDRPIFKKLKFIKTKKTLRIYTIINNCICLYNLKLQINKLEHVIPERSFKQDYIKFLKTFSDDNYYMDFMVDKDYFKKNPQWKKIDKLNDTFEKRISNFLRLYWSFSFEYYSHLKNNRISLKKMFYRVFHLHNEGKTITAKNLKITNKALKRSLDRIKTEKGFLSDSIGYDSKMNLLEPEKNRYGEWDSRTRILQLGLLILGHRLPSKRKKYAKLAEEQTGIPFTKIIPMNGYSNLLQDAPEDPFQSIDPLIKRDYEEHYKIIGIPPQKIIPKDGGEPYYLFHDPKDFSRLTREWKGSST